MAFGTLPASAMAAQTTTPGEIAAAYDELMYLRSQVELNNNDLITATVTLDQTKQHIAELNVQIEDSSNRLTIARTELSQFVAEDYKSGQISLLDIILNSASVDELVTNIVVANKVATLLRDRIDTVNNLNAQLLTERVELEQAQHKQEEAVTLQAQSLEAATAAADRAEAYYNQLSEDMRRQVDEQEQLQRAQAAVASLQLLAEMAGNQDAGHQAPAAGGYDGGEFAGGPEGGAPAGGSGPMDDGPAPASGPAPMAPSYSDLSQEDVQQLLNDVSNTLGFDAAETLRNSGGDYSSLVDAAMSKIGSGYQYSGYTETGDTSTSSYTCSGLVDAALGRPSQSSSPESLYEEVGSNMTSDISALNEGDLVFYSYGGREVGHVGIYDGNGHVIDSAPNGGVAVRDVDYMDFVGGGSL